MTTPPHEPPPGPQPYQPYPTPAAGATPQGDGTLPGFGMPPSSAAPGYGMPGTSPAPGYGMPPIYGAPPQPAYALPPVYGEVPAGYGMPQPYYPYPVAVHRPYDGMAIASLVLSCAAALGLCVYGIGGVLGIVGAILGHVARSRLKRNGRDGDGLALAGIIVGWALAAISAVIVAVLVVLIVRSGDDSF